MIILCFVVVKLFFFFLSFSIINILCVCVSVYFSLLLVRGKQK